MSNIRRPADIARRLAGRAHPRDAFRRETFALPRAAARAKAREIFRRFPKAAYMTEIQFVARAARRPHRVHNAAAAERGLSHAVLGIRVGHDAPSPGALWQVPARCWRGGSGRFSLSPVLPNAAPATRPPQSRPRSPQSQARQPAGPAPAAAGRGVCGCGDLRSGCRCPSPMPVR